MARHLAKHRNANRARRPVSPFVISDELRTAIANAFVSPGDVPSSDPIECINALAAELRVLRAGVSAEVAVFDISKDGPWKLMVAGQGVAQWPSDAAREQPRLYAEEVAKCLRVALGRKP